MGKGLIIAIVVIVIIAVAAYMYLYGGGIPSVTTPAAETGAAPAETTIDESGASATATQAETTVSEAAGEIGAADSLEVPGVNE